VKSISKVFGFGYLEWMKKKEDELATFG